MATSKGVRSSPKSVMAAAPAETEKKRAGSMPSTTRSMSERSVNGREGSKADPIPTTRVAPCSAR